MKGIVKLEPDEADTNVCEKCILEDICCNVTYMLCESCNEDSHFVLNEEFIRKSELDKLKASH